MAFMCTRAREQLLGCVPRGAEHERLDDEGVNAAIALVCHTNARCICFDSLNFGSLQQQVAANAFRLANFMSQLRVAFDAKPFLLPIQKGGNQ
jgi:hypothetical protein